MLLVWTIPLKTLVNLQTNTPNWKLDA